MKRREAGRDTRSSLLLFLKLAVVRVVVFVRVVLFFRSRIHYFKGKRPFLITQCRTDFDGQLEIAGDFQFLQSGVGFV